MVVVHDLDLVREHFPETLLLARQPVAWGDDAGDAEAGEPVARPPFRRGLGATMRHGASPKAMHGTISHDGMRTITITAIITPLRPQAADRPCTSL